MLTHFFIEAESASPLNTPAAQEALAATIKAIDPNATIVEIDSCVTHGHIAVEKQFPATNGQHVATGGAFCPICGSPHIEGSEINIADGRATQEQFCQDCESEWEDIYLFSGYVAR